MMVYRVKFLPSERLIQVDGGTSILEGAMKAGVHINASCGGNGTCGKCRIVVRSGPTEDLAPEPAGYDGYEQGIRLACRTLIKGDVEVEVPLESQVDRVALKRRREAPHILSASHVEGLVAPREPDPPVLKKYVVLPEPTLSDNRPDLDRLAGAMGEAGAGGEPMETDVALLRGLGKKLRDSGWKVTATVDRTGVPQRLIRMEDGDRTKNDYALAVDVGTTTVCGRLLGPGPKGPYSRIVAEYADYNRQISFGEDVISRIFHARKPGGLEALQAAAASSINTVLVGLLEASGVKREHITQASLAGNTTMTHLLLGIDPGQIMISPYTPVASTYPRVGLSLLGIDLPGHVEAHFFPSPASYVGGDIVAGVLGSGMCEREELTLFMDMGTNGEIVLGNRDWLTCASCSAGPAFEGGGIEFGMRAGAGAIEQVRIDPATGEPMILTVGKVKPRGICGSGLIDTAAGLLEASIIDRRGKFREEGKDGRVRRGRSGMEYVLCDAADTDIGRDIVITGADLDNLLRTKGAVYAGCKVLLKSVGLGFSDVGRVIIAGGFGHYIDLETAVTIGLLPELPPEKFLFIGNGAILGAELVVRSREFLKESMRITRMMTNIELSTDPAFMEEFVAAMFLPHTDGQSFPLTIARLEAGEGRQGNDKTGSE